MWRSVTANRGQLLFRVALVTGAELASVVLLQIERGYLASVFSIEAFGRFAYLLSMLEIFAVFVLLGFDMILLRFASIYRDEGRWSAFNGLLLTSIVVPIAATAALMLMYGATLSSAFPSPTDHLVLVAVLLAILALLNIGKSLTQVVGLAHLSSIPRNVAFPILSLCAIYFMHGQLRDWPAIDLMITARIIAGIAVVILAALIVVARAPVGHNWRSGIAVEPGPWIDHGRYLFMVAVVAVALNWLDVVVAGNLVSEEQLGTYVLVTRMAAISLIGQIAMNVLFGAVVAPLVKKGRMREVQSLLTINVLFAIGISLLLILAIIGGAPAFLGLVADGVTFDYTLYWTVQLAYLVNIGCGSVAFLLLMSGRHREVAIIFLATLAASVVGTIVLGNLFGLVGVAIGSAGAIAANNVVLAVYAKRALGLDTTILAVLRSRISVSGSRGT